MHKMSKIPNFVPVAEGAGPMNRFFHDAFLAQLKPEQLSTFVNFNSAVSAVMKPTVRLSCEQAGFSEKSLVSSTAFKQDPHFQLFKNWLDWMVASGKEPDTGAVTGDTWKDFQRTYRRSGPRIYCTVVASGDAEPIEGSV